MNAQRLFAAVLIVAGVVVNPWTLEATVVPDGDIDSPVVLLVVGALQVLALGFGGLLWSGRIRLRLPTAAEWLLLACSLVPSVLAIEWALHSVRFLNEFRPIHVGEYQNQESKNFIADAATGWRMRPNQQIAWRIDGAASTYRANSLGFRSNAEFAADETRRIIVVVGDSFAFGTGVDFEATFGALVEAALPGTVVDNLAMPGFGIDQMWMSLRHQALPLQPALIVLAFIDRDFDRSLTAYRENEGLNKPRFLLRAGALAPETAADLPNVVVRELERHSSLWAAGGLLSRWVGHYAPLGEWWRLNQAILGAALDDCRTAGVPLLVLRLPQRGDRHSFVTLSGYLRRAGAAYLDLEELATPTHDDLHFATDDHINAKGHRFVADAVLRWIDAHRDALALPQGDAPPGLAPGSTTSPAPAPASTALPHS